MVYPTYFRICLWSVTKIIELFYIPVFIIRLFQKPIKCPPIQNRILLLPAKELARKIRNKEISSIQAVEAYISRVKEVNSVINAVIEDRFQEAIKDAQRADALISQAGLTEEQLKSDYPLLGVPLTVKGSIAVAGLIHTAGRVDHIVRAEKDGVSVKRARDAGAIPILTSNVPELCLNWETKNKLIGITRNPYNSTRTVGGSSGGETSLLGCGASLIGIGSDIAGSLRLPAHYCGVWGHKPSPLVVSCTGHYPDCSNREEWDKVFTLGPLARYASDLRYLLEVIVEPEKKALLKLNEEVDLKQLRFYYSEDPKTVLMANCNRDVVEAVEKVVNYFNQNLDNKCSKVDIPLMKYCNELSYTHLLNIDDIENLFEGKGNGAYSELLRSLTFRSKHEMTSILYGLLRRNIHLIPKTSMRQIYQDLDELRKEFIKILGDDGVFICPTSPSEALYHGDSLRKVFEYGYCSIFNALGFPVTNCQISFTRNGLPVGLQVVAAPNCDRLTLTVAEELERAFGGWKPPQ